LTTVQTPRFWGAPPERRTRRWLIELNVNCNAGDFDLTFLVWRPLRISWLIVGTFASEKSVTVE
jgi:hypothetical protein